MTEVEAGGGDVPARVTTVTKLHPHVTEKKTGLGKQSPGPGVEGHRHPWTERRGPSDRGAHLGVRVGLDPAACCEIISGGREQANTHDKGK